MTAMICVHATREEIERYVKQSLGKENSYTFDEFLQIQKKVSTCSECLHAFVVEYGAQTAREKRSA